MKNSVKGIIGLSAALVVLGGGAAALLLTDPKDGGSSESESSETEQQIKILIHDDKTTGTDPETGADLKGVIKTVDVKNPTDEFHVVQKTSQTEESAATYTLDGYQDVVMNDSVIGTMANNANGLTSEAVVEENCTDLAKFGLETPVITVDIEYETGTKYRMFIGDEAPVGDVSYVMIDGVDTVFTVRNSALANYRKTLLDLVETTILKAPEEYPKVNSLRIKRADMKDDILLEYDEKSEESEYSGGTSSVHVMTEPTFAYLSVESSTEMVTGMFGLSADGIYAVHCSKSDIAEAGLKKPYCTVTMDCDDGNKYDLLLSEPFADGDGKSCYGMLKGGNVIFIIDAEKVKWVTVKPVDIASRIFIASYVWNIPELSVTCGKDEYAFEIERIDPDEEVEKLTAENFSVKLNGKEFDSERYRQFYSFLISAHAEDFALDEKKPKGEPMASLKFTDSFTGETYEFDFYEKSSMQALITANGESKFTISKSYVETLIENAENLDSDTEFKTTWK
ncbi:MAG: DUF4340 domain-containing protein [Ruminococcus sp.]|nr:DUF4340 domain-containing protein [Ruminococcus sp.]